MTSTNPFDETGHQYAWDSTSLKLAETCLYKYGLKMGLVMSSAPTKLGWQPARKSAHLIFGGLYASALEDYHKAIAQGVDREQAIRDVVHDALIATWEHDLDENDEPIEGTGAPWQSDHNLKTRGNLIRSIIWYFDQFRDDPCTTVILSTGAPAVEHSFKLPVDNGILFAGHLDRLVDYAGQLMVQDQKAQPVSERVLTPSGWKAISDLTVGEFIFAEDGKPHVLTAIHSKGEVEIYEVHFNDGTSTRCAWDHLWGVYSQGGKYYVLSMQELATTPKTKKFRIPLVKPIQHQERKFILQPMALGLLLGDGYLKGSVIQFSDQDGVEARRLGDLLPEGDDIISTSSDNYTWNIRGGKTKAALQQLGLFGKLSRGKFIPSEYFLGSEQQRRDLLAGLLATDGCFIETNWLYDSTSEQLVQDVCQLVRSLGGTASYHSRSGPAFRAHLRMPEWKNGIRKRYITRITKLPYTEQAACLSIDSPKHLYLTENYILTHNTTGTTITGRFFEGFKPDSQMSLYTFAGKAIFNLPVKGVMIDGAQIAVGFTRFERGFTFRAADELEEWYEGAMHTIELARTAARENYFPMNPSACGNYGGCEFRFACSKSPAVREQFLKGDYVLGEIWSPLRNR